MKFKAIKLKLRGPLTEIPHADTLFGAMATAVGVLYGKEAIDEFAERFQRGARISSAFPYEGEKLFLPKPLSAEYWLSTLPEEKIKGIPNFKRLKSAKYLSLGEFEKALRLEQFTYAELPFKRVELPRVALDRVTSNSALYFWEEIRFKPNTGIYFLYQGDGETLKGYILPALRYLGDTGIGGKGTWGYGLFDIEVEDVEISVPRGEAFVTLSNTLPSETPLLWRLFRKGGWSPWGRKPKLSFIEEGSIIGNDSGKIETLTVGGKGIYVYGLSFPLPAKLPEGLP
ncbi:CRISPR-associated RAMP protein, Csm4 family [Thermococcus sp. 2319x1]|uniref:type III-A CRISPR-associated RAMP protein Csm4 n=1 Tax=Thermococcus sp. 2319x1 TaxID=1674923 RepID=UPI00073A638C|nr:type III-A CRISPR-associated RAMP protein Csm4 [Thermococcus sp. 2319x1]ALV63518.1 CRISPR-associated RAMP protein, Csm4 family [Thermococcus sp. 2319x1]